MRNTKRWLAVLLSASMVLNTGMVSTAAAVTDGVQPVTENEAVDGQEVGGQKADAGAGQTENADAGQTENQQVEAGDAKTGDQEEGAAEEIQTPEQSDDGTTKEQQPTNASATQEGEEGQEEVASFITEIATEADLLEFAKNVAAGHTYADETVTLKNDITLTAAWAPIGGTTKDTSFQGTFEGGEHTITYAGATSTSDRYWGLFHSNYGTVQNVTLAGKVSGNFYVGAVASENYGTIKRCINQADIDDGLWMGGIVSYNKKTGIVEECANYGTISSGSACGIAYQNEGKITSCFNAGDIRVSTSDGSGLVCQNEGSLENSYSVGVMSVTSYASLYGISSSNYSSGNTVANCYYAGTTDKLDKTAGLYSMTGVTNTYMLEGSGKYLNRGAAANSIKTDEEMRGKEFADTLGSAYKVNPGNGYPLLLWQTENGTEEPIELQNLEISHRTATDSFELTGEALTVGAVYYLVQDKDATAPTAEEVVAKGTGTKVAKGAFTIEAAVASVDEQTVYVVLQSKAGFLSQVYQGTLEKWSTPSLTKIQVADNGELTFAAASRSVKVVCDTDVTDLTFKLLFSDGEGAGLDISYVYTDADGKEQTVTETTPGEKHTFQNFLKKDVNGNSVKITVTANGESQEYKIRVVRRSVLQSLQVSDQNDQALTLTPVFDKSVADYEIFADDALTDVKFATKQPTDLKAIVRYNGTDSEDGTYTQKLTSEQTENVTIEVANSAAEHRIYTVQINKTLADFAVERKTESAKVTFQAGAAGTVYYQVGEAGADVTAETLKTSGRSKAVVKGENVLEITGIDKAGKYLYICFANEQVTSNVKEVNLLKIADPYFTSLTIGGAKVTLDPETLEGTVVIDSNTTSVSIHPDVAGNHGPAANTYYIWTDADGKEVRHRHYPGSQTETIDEMLKKTTAPMDMKIYSVEEGDAPQNYIIHIQRRAVASALKLTDQEGNELKYTPSFNARTDGATYSLMVWDDVESVKIKATDPTTDEPTFKFNDTEVKGDTYTVKLTDGQTEKVTVTPVDAKAAESRSFDVVINRTLSDLTATYRKEDSVRISATAGIAGEVYCVVQDPDAEAPDADTVMKKGQHGDGFIKGDNELILSGIGKDAKKVYLLLEDDDGNCSKVYGIDVKAYEANLLNGFKNSLTEEEVVFDFETKTAEITAATIVDSLTFTPILPKGEEGAADVKLVYSYTGTDGSAKTLEKTAADTVTFTDLLAVDSAEKDLTIKASKEGKEDQTYVVHIAREAVLTELKLEDQDGNALALTPEFNAYQSEYDVVLPDSVTSVKFTVKDPTNETPKLLAWYEEKTGPTWEEEMYDETNIEEYTIQLDREEGKVYTLNLLRLFAESNVKNRTSDSVDVTFTSGIDGDVYYLLQAKDEEAPTVDRVVAEGKKAQVTKGENTLKVTELKDTAYKMYLVVKNDNITSAVHTCDVQQFYPLMIQIGSTKVYFDWTTKSATYKLRANDKSTYSNIKVSVPNKTSSSPTTFAYEYTDTDGTVHSSQTSRMDTSLRFNKLTKPNSTEGNELKISITENGEVQEYTLHIIRTLLINQMNIVDQNAHKLTWENSFNAWGMRTEYNVYLDGDSTSVTFTANDPMSGNEEPVFEVNGTEVKGKNWTLDVKSDKEQTVTVKIKTDDTSVEALTYTVNLIPMLSVELEENSRTDTTAKINGTAGYAGKLYYLVQDPDAEAPTADKVMTDGTEGNNVVAKKAYSQEITGLTSSAAKVYVVMQETTNNSTLMLSVDMPAAYLLGDLNDDGTVNIADVVKLLDLVTAGETVETGLGDLNGDGVVNIADVVKLLDLVTAGEI